MFYGNLNLLDRFPTLTLKLVESFFNIPQYLTPVIEEPEEEILEYVESFFNIPQYLTLKILLAAIRALETGHIIYNKKFAIVPVKMSSFIFFIGNSR